MGMIATALKHMLAAGMVHEDIVAAVEGMEATGTAKSKGAERTARWRERHKTSQNVTGDECDAFTPVPDKENPQTPIEINPSPQTPNPTGLVAPSAEIASAIDAYSKMAERAGLAVPRVVTGARRQRIGAIVRLHGLPVWLEAVGKVEASEFCRGANDRGWKADLDFMTQAKSFAGILEGRYDNRARGSPISKPNPGLAAADALMEEFDAVSPSPTETNSPYPRLVARSGIG